MKRLIALALAMLCGAAFTLASCGGTGESDPVVKVIDIALTEEQYAPIKAQRQAWQDEINTLEEEMRTL